MTDYSNMSVDELESEYKKILTSRIKEQLNTKSSKLDTSGENSNFVANAVFTQFKSNFIESMKNKEGISMVGDGYENTLRRLVKGHYHK